MNSRNLTEGPVPRRILDMSAPMVWGILATMTFNVADTYFVGRLGADALAAIGYTFPVVFALTSVALGLGIGVGSVLSRTIGANDMTKAKQLTADALLLAILIVACLSVIGFFSIDALFSALGASGAVLELIRGYMQIWFLSAVFVVIPMVSNNAIRAAGEARLPSLIMIGAALINIVLDPLLIFGLGPIPALGFEGAAWASVIARFLSLLAALWVMIVRLDMISLKLQRPSAILRAWREMLHVAVPTMATNVSTPLAMMLVTAILARYGDAAVAAFGVASRIEAFAIVPLFALTAGLAPVVGQNWGARRPNRVHAAIRTSYLFSLGWGLLVAALLAVLARPLMGLFSSQAEVIAIGSSYLWIVPITFGAYGVIICTNAIHNAVGQPLVASMLNISRSLLVYVGMAWLVSLWLPVWAVFASAAVANAGVALLAWWWTQRLERECRAASD